MSVHYGNFKEHFEKLTVIGEGSFGKVYLCQPLLTTGSENKDQHNVPAI